MTTIDLRLDHPDAVFHPLDPTPRAQRDLAPSVVDYILDHAAEAPAREPITVRLHSPRAAPMDAALVQAAARRHFERAAHDTAQETRRFFRRGWAMMLTGLVTALVLVGLAQLLASVAQTRLLTTLANGMSIIIWVILWRPVETLVFDWRPLRERERLFRRLASLTVQAVPFDDDATRP